MSDDGKGSILVVGSGMSGITTAIEAAEAGYEVNIVERNPYLGGRVAQLYHYFPKLCSPNCGLEINFRRIKQNPKIHYYTMAEVDKISGTEGNFSVSLKIKPRYVNGKCTGCGKCADACSLEIDNEFNYGMDKIKAAYLPYDMAFPMQYVLDPAVINSAEANKIKDACPYDAIDLEMKEENIELSVSSIVWATGWKPYDAKKLDTYGFGEYQNVITNVMMERLASNSGPTQGKIVRPSDGKVPETVAFVQCAGSRDQNHLPYCSGICCLASMKQAIYIKEQHPNTKMYIFYIDIRATDRLEEFYSKVQKEENVEFVKGKVAQIKQDNDKLTLKFEDTTQENLKEMSVDMVVLATGMQPNTAETQLPVEAAYDEYGFMKSPNGTKGIYAAGCTKTPANVSEVVQDGTAAALKAIQSVGRRDA